LEVGEGDRLDERVDVVATQQAGQHRDLSLSVQDSLVDVGSAAHMASLPFEKSLGHTAGPAAASSCKARLPAAYAGDR